MKKKDCLITLFISAVICLLCSCNPHEYHKITIAINDTCSLEQQSIAYEVINKRIASIWHIKEKTDLTDGKFDLIYSGSDSLLTQMLTQKGEIYITEIYLNYEIQSSLDMVYKKLFWLIENTDHEPLWEINDYQSSYYTGIPDLINVPLQQIAFIDSIFNRCKHFFPADISFAWTATSREGFFDLLALKSTSQPFPLNPNTVKTCRIDNLKYNHDDILLNYQEIVISLEKNYYNEWAEMTRSNIRKNLAFVMDGKVLMYPRVHSEITSGKLVITGDFENSEFLLIKSAILGGTLDCKAQILKFLNL